MYEIVTVNSEMKLPEIDLKYQGGAPTVESDEWLTVSVRYKLPENEESELRSYPFIPSVSIFPPSENIRFASCVVQFGMLLRDSAFKGDATYNGIVQELSNLDCVSSDEYKKEFLSLVKQVND
jgi:Ca-activated chloride channel family protein